MTISAPTAKDNGTISTIEKRLAEVFPAKSFYLKNPEGTDARSDQSVATFREDWAKKQKINPEIYKKRAAQKSTVNINARYDIGTIKQNMAEALGIPPAAIVLMKNSTEKSKTNIKLSTFRGYWR